MNLKNKILSSALSAVIAISAFSVPVQQNMGSIAITAEAAATVEAPRASSSSGTWVFSDNVKKITLTCKTKNAKIYYSLNGSSYKLYSSDKPILLTKNSTLKTYAKYGGNKSKTVTYTYKLTPIIKPDKAAGTYDSAITVKIKKLNSNVKYYYTLDGTTPTTKSSLYSSSKGIKITETCTLKVISVKSGLSKGSYSGKYTIKKSGSTVSTETNPVKISGPVLPNFNAYCNNLLGVYADETNPEFNRFKCTMNDNYKLVLEYINLLETKYNYKLTYKSEDSRNCEYLLDYVGDGNVEKFNPDRYRLRKEETHLYIWVSIFSGSITDSVRIDYAHGIKMADTGERTSYKIFDERNVEGAMTATSSSNSRSDDDDDDYCGSCGGDRKCSRCNGKGKIKTHMAGTTKRIWQDCPKCINGRCTFCIY